MDVSKFPVGVQEKKETGSKFLLYNHLILKQSIRILSFGYKCSFYNVQN